MKVIRFIAIWFCVLLVSGMYAQRSENIDSLQSLLLKPLTDTGRVNLLNRIAADMYYSNSDSIEPYAREAYNLANNIDYQKGIAEAFNNLGIFYRSKGIYNEAIDYFFNSLSIMEGLNDVNGIARSYNLIGIIHYYLGNYDLSLDYYLKALNINEEQNDKQWIAGNSNNIGMIYELKGDYSKALDYYLLSLNMNTELGLDNWVANNLGNIGSLYLKMNDPLSLEFFQKRLQLKEKIGDKEGISRSNFLIGNYYLNRGDYQKAISFYISGYEFASETKSLINLRNNSEKLSECYARLNEFDEAYQYHKLFKKYSDSLNLDQNSVKITRLQMQHEYREKQQIEKLKNEQSRVKHSLVSIGLFILITLTILLINRQRSIVKINKRRQQQLSLNNQSLTDQLKFKEQLMQDNINYLLDKNEIITTTIEKLNQLKSTIAPENDRYINDVLIELKGSKADDTWEEFELRFKQIHHNFYQKLSELFPGLTANEVKLCAFLKLDLRSKDIAAITKQSVKSVEIARTRLRKKLDLVNKNISLAEYLNNLD
ncbi:MAG: DUF5112 domain-containing protein [Bacteroidales bacterium]|nr:DUF5112 domain-containing protein [Bacteroidales bacterium]